MSHQTSTPFPDGSTSDPTAAHKYRYSVVKGLFAQDEDDFVPTPDQIEPQLGLLDDAGRWPDVRAMNESARDGVSFKLIIAGRHGQGFHNVAIQKYGEMTWGPDPLLTPIGLDQAKTAHEAWNLYRPPTPDALFSSPFRRALRTCEITFPGRRVKVLENIREKLTGWTCDVRSPISTLLTSEFPLFDFSSYGALLIPDPCADLRTETEAEAADRARKALDYIFDNEGEAQDVEVVSITAHAGWMRALFDTVGRRR
ncbi:hypothetical protein EXIGLDRAFT_720073, partial [Exidia glandulosa HHB12029]